MSFTHCLPHAFDSLGFVPTDVLQVRCFMSFAVSVVCCAITDRSFQTLYISCRSRSVLCKLTVLCAIQAVLHVVHAEISYVQRKTSCTPRSSCCFNRFCSPLSTTFTERGTVCTSFESCIHSPTSKMKDRYSMIVSHVCSKKIDTYGCGSKVWTLPCTCPPLVFHLSVCRFNIFCSLCCSPFPRLSRTCLLHVLDSTYFFCILSLAAT